MEEENTDSLNERNRITSLINSIRFSCCSDFLQPRNRVLPHGLEPLNSSESGVQYVEPSPGRRLRVICVRPSHPLQSLSTTNGADDDSEELSEEEYWFESAAPNRLPVIQPLPPPPQSRIINKFEPQEASNSSQIGSPGAKQSSPGDCISPGRLPRKKLGSRISSCVEEDDDLEEDDDDDDVDIYQNNLGNLGESEVLPKEPSEAVNSEMLDAIDSIIASNNSKTDKDNPADDSCHPSPEVPHRSVCASPDPDKMASDKIPPIDPAEVKVMGGNLGGMANKGFSHDEDDKIEADENNTDEDDKGSESTEVSTDTTTTIDTPDTGYSRNRDLQPDVSSAPPAVAEIAVPTAEEAISPIPVLFFLHGVGGSADVWQSQIRHFSNLGYTCIAPDMLGHGFSACPDSAKSYTFCRLFKDILAIFDAFVPVESRAVVFGHSYGCSFSVALARTRPERVCTLVLVAGGGPTPLAPPPNQSPKTGMKWILSLLRRLIECKLRRSSQQKYNPRGKTLRFNEAYDVPSYVLDHVKAGQVWPEGDAGFHRRVTAPCLLVYGMRDNLVSLVEECEMERTLPKAFLELVPTAGHTVMLDTPNQLNTMTERFIKKWTNNM